MIHDVVIVGSDRRLYTAAIPRPRSSIRSSWRFGDTGGALMNTTEVGLPRLRRGMRGLKFASDRAGERFGADIRYGTSPPSSWGDVSSPPLTASRPAPSSSPPAQVPAPGRREERLSGHGVLLRHLRRVLQGPGHCRRRWWGLGHGGGHLPDHFARSRDGGPPPRRTARLGRHGQAPRKTQLSFAWNSQSSSSTARTHDRRVTLEDTVTGDPPPARATGLFVAIGQVSTQRARRGVLGRQAGCIRVEAPQRTRHPRGLLR